MRFSFLTCVLTIALALATTGQVHAGNKHTWRAGKPVHITTSPAGLQTFSWSPSGEILALFYQDGNIVLQNTKTNHKTAIRKVFPAESAYALKWCADGKPLVVALSERAALIDPETGLVKPMKLEEVAGAFFIEENLKAMDKLDIGGGSVELASVTNSTVTIRRIGSNLSKGGKSAASPVRAVSPNGKLCMLASKQVLEVHDCAWGRETSCRSLPQNFQVQKIWWLNNNDV